MQPDRRQVLRIAGAGVLGAALALPSIVIADDKEKEHGKEVEAVEDLMREHGLLRRALLVYSEAASRLARGDRDVPPAELVRTAKLFRSFGEDYHERSLEEKHVFVPLLAAGGTSADLAKTLTAQHERGREITDYITTVASKGRITDATTLFKVLTDFVRMYEHHAALEDTVIFPAWKAAITPEQYHEASEQFEELEQRMFGRDGFEDSLRRVAAIEEAFGLADLNALTAPEPPKSAG